MRISDWSSDVCSSDLGGRVAVTRARASQPRDFSMPAARSRPCGAGDDGTPRSGGEDLVPLGDAVGLGGQRGVGIALDLHRLDGVALLDGVHRLQALRSEGHTSELQSLMRNSYAV